MRFQSIAAAFVAGCIVLCATPAIAETLKGQTALASYQVPGFCAESDSATGQLHLASCAQKAPQEFHMETFNDIAQHVSWQKIMRGKDCLQARWDSKRASLYTERCAISTWSKGAFWAIGSSGDMYSEEKYCPYRKDGGLAAGTPLIGETCRWYQGAEFYPAIVTRSAKVGPETLKSYTAGQEIKAIVIANGFSAGNLVASEGAFLTIDRSGKVSVTSGGVIIAGGAGYLIQQVLSKVPGAAVISPADFSASQPDDYSPKDLAFFKQKDRGKISYDPR